MHGQNMATIEQITSQEGICLAVFSGNLHGILGRAFRKFKPTLGGLKLKMFACSSLFLGCVQFHQRN